MMRPVKGPPDCSGCDRRGEEAPEDAPVTPYRVPVFSTQDGILSGRYVRGVIDKVDCPVLVIHGAKDRLFPPEQAERIAREAKHATLLMYPDGNHVCNNITYKYRPAMADWMKERLA